jgi:hypothetical protein
MTITVEGVADGAHSLFVYGGDVGDCSPELGGAKNPLLSKPGGEALSEGPFKRGFVVVPDKSSYYACAYLYASPDRFPDAWRPACIVMPMNECYVPMITPLDVIAVAELAKRAADKTAEEFAARVSAEEAQVRHEREAAERVASEEAATRRAEEEAQQKAREAARCHVPRVLGHTQTGAKRLLAAAHCRVGHVTIRRGARRPLHVVWQRPGRGGSYPAGTFVAVRLD